MPLDADQRPAPCLRYRPLENDVKPNTSCPPELFTANVTEVCDDWVFEESVKTIATEFKILCPEDYWKRTLMSSLWVITSAIGLPLTGFISDRFGRKRVLLVCSLSVAASGILRSYTPSLELLVVLEIFDGIVAGAVVDSAFLLGLETLSPRKRLVRGMLICLFFVVGEIVMAVDMWVVGDWRVMIRTFYTPMLALVILHWLLPESVRWLYAHKQYDEVEKIIHKIAKMNNSIDKAPDIIKSIRLLPRESRDQYPPQDVNRATPISTLLKSRVLMWRVVACSLCWTVSNITSFGITQISVYLNFNRYLTFIAICLVEMPTYLVCMWLPGWKPLGRRGCLSWSLFLAGCTFMAMYFATPDQVLLNICLSLAGKILSASTFAVMFVYVAELFPTEFRQSLLSVCDTVACLGVIVAQQIPLIEMYVNPLLVFMVVSVAGGLLIMTCPETLGTTLPDTIQEAEALS